MAFERHGAQLMSLRRAILETRGATSLEDRAAAASGAPGIPVAGDYLDKVRSASFRITDADVDRLKSGGLSDDAILELTLASAFGEASRRFEAAMTSLRQPPEADHAP
jgi:hypothetical protein